MGLKEKLKSTRKKILFSVLGGLIVAANIYTLVDFQKHMNYMRKNPDSFESINDRCSYANTHLRENEKFPNNFLTFLSRQDAKSFIEIFNNLYH
jgi:hypothetical protein